MAKDWVVYSKTYLDNPDTVIRYLGRYTRKIAISESRLRTVTDQHVTFDYKDYRDNEDKHMTLRGHEFLRRFLLHVLPQGFMRIRHYGFLSNRTRRKKLDMIRQCLQAPSCEPIKMEIETDKNPVACRCPKCKKGQLLVRYDIMPPPFYGR